MKFYNSFVGIDIGKYNFVVAVHDCKSVKEYENTLTGITQFIKEFKKKLPTALCVLEPTGGYEMSLLLTLCEYGYSVHRAHTRNVKNFIRSFGNKAKTDKLDAKSLSLYGFERSKSLEIFTPTSKEAGKLYELVQRRRDLKQMLVAEKNRLKSPRTGYVKSSIKALVNVLSDEIGNIIANELLVLLPELGKLSRREIASLVGVAPISRDSGKLKGYRRTNHGRGGIKPILFLAAMAARNSKSRLKDFYENLVGRGKNKMVAITALMRKIIVIANARLKNVLTT
jgi:transposase